MVQALGDLAVGKPGLLVEFDDGGLGIGPELGGGSPEGVGGLQGMAALHSPAALPALADVDVELPMNGLTRDFDLELLGDVGFVERAAAISATFARRFVDLVDLFGARRLAMRLGAVVLAGLAPGFLGLGTGLALGERRGLSLAGTESLVELAAEAQVLGLEVADTLLKGLAASTPERFHTAIIGSAS